MQVGGPTRQNGASDRPTAAVRDQRKPGLAGTLRATLFRAPHRLQSRTAVPVLAGVSVPVHRRGGREWTDVWRSEATCTGLSLCGGAGYGSVQNSTDSQKQTALNFTKHRIINCKKLNIFVLM